MFVVPDHSVAFHLKRLTGFGAVNITRAALLRERCVGRNANLKRSYNSCGLPLTSNLTSPQKRTTQIQRPLLGFFSYPLLTLSLHCVDVLVEPNVTLRTGKMLRKMDLGAHETYDFLVCQSLQQTLEATVWFFRLHSLNIKGVVHCDSFSFH